ncbi:MAG: glycosyltransferase [Firmicutes bacterium]|nr:glycosyltransferase [Bacillota bacterium]
MENACIVFLRSNPVDPDSRVEKEVNSLIKAGYKVKVVAWDRSSRYRIKEFNLNLENGVVKIYRFGIPATFGEGRKNLIAFILFQVRLFLWLFKNRKQYQILHACDFDTAYTAFYCAKLFKKKLIFDIFDYLFTHTNGRFSAFKKFIVCEQHKIINYADGTIICTEKRKEQIHGSKPKLLTVIHNSTPQVGEIISKIELNDDKTKIVYVGILQDGRFLKELADVIKELPNCELHIGGFGKYESYFKDMSFNYDNIIYYGKLPYSKTLQLEKSCDIMTAIYDPAVGNHYYSAPNKFYEALMLGKPLIMVKNTGQDEVVSQNDIGEVIDFNVESLKVGIDRLIKRKAEWSKISIKMKRIYEQDYSWDKMEKRLVRLYRNI